MKTRHVLTVGLLVVILASCRSETTTPGSRPPPEASPPTATTTEQRLFLVALADPRTFNPLLTVDRPSSEAIGPVFDPLVRLNPKTTEMEPALAESWESNAAGTEWVFHLRPNVRWHDGEPLTADDVVFTFEAVFDDRVPNSSKHVLTVGGRPLDVTARDAQTVVVRLAQPFAPLLRSLDGIAILPRHILGAALKAGTFTQQWGINTAPERVVGTGPFRLVRYVPAQFIELERNPDYWLRDEAGLPLPRLDRQTILIVPDQDTAHLKFLAGETHVHSPRPEEVPELKEREASAGIQVVELGLETGSTFVTFNRNPRHYVKNGKKDPRLGWFTDRLFLRALAHSIDREAMVLNCLNGFGRPSVSYISPENRHFHNPQLEPYDYDLTRAQELLEQGGYVDRDGDGIREDATGNPIEFNLTTNAGNRVREKMCAIIQEDWNKLGFKVNYRPVDFTLLVEKLDNTFDWDAVLIGFTGGIEPHNGANFLRSSGNLHTWNPNQPTPATEWEAEIDRLVDEGSRELDAEKRRTIYGRIQQILNDELPMIQTVRQTQFVAHSKKLRHFEPTVWGLYHPERIRIAE